MDKTMTVSTDYIRVAAQAFGALCGQNLVILQRRSADINYSDDVKNGVIRLDREINLWETKRVLINHVGYEPDANGGVVFTFNNDSKYQLPMISSQTMEDYFPKITPATVARIYEQAHAAGREAIFIDYPGLVEQIIALNNGSKQIAQRLADRMLRIAGLLEQTNENEYNVCKSEMAQLGQIISFAVK